MAGFWGLKEIATRMGWKDTKTPTRQAMLSGFPIFRRRKGRRTEWFTEDSLIHLWELQRAKIDRAELLKRTESNRGRKNTRQEKDLTGTAG